MTKELGGLYCNDGLGIMEKCQDHNKQVLKPKIESFGCNCRDRDDIVLLWTDRNII